MQPWLQHLLVSFDMASALVNEKTELRCLCELGQVINQLVDKPALAVFTIKSRYEHYNYLTSVPLTPQRISPSIPVDSCRTPSAVSATGGPTSR